MGRRANKTNRRRTVTKPRTNVASIAGALALAVLAGVCLASRPARAARGRDHLVLYFPRSHAVLPLETLGRTSYFPLLQLLNLTGNVTGLQEGRKRLKIYYGNTRIQVDANKNLIRLDNVRMKLAAPMRLVNGAWEAPVDFLNQVLPTLTNKTVVYDAHGERVFVGDVKPNTFSVQQTPTEGGTLVRLQFAQPVRVTTAATNGRWIIYLGKHPVEPVHSSYQFNTPYLESLRFDDQDGSPKLIFTPGAAGLNFYPKLAQGGTVLDAEIAKPGVTPTIQPMIPSSPPRAAQAAPAPSSPPSAQASAPASPIPSPAPIAPAPSAAPNLPAVVLDAAGGGADAGAQGPNSVLEKNLTAQLVARVESLLLATGRFRVILTRAGDADPSFNQRAATANAAAPVCFVTFSAGDLGAMTPRVLVFTSQATAPISAPPSDPLFVPWRSAQQPFIARSQQLAQAVDGRLQKIFGVSTLSPQTAPVRVLESIQAPAIAVEVGSLDPATNPSVLTNANFQQQVANAVASGVEAYAGIQGAP